MSDLHSRRTWSPTFIGIGAEKAATTWVWNKLDQHPAVEMSQPKEVNYFNEQFDRGSAWYEKHFRRTPGCVQGEISPLYLDHPEAAQRIAECCPDVRLLVMLRNPFDRALSHLMHEAQNEYGGVADLTAEHFRVLADRDERFVRRSCYAAGLDGFLKHFRRDRIGLFFYEDVAERPLDLIQRVYRFLAVDDSFVPDGLQTAMNRSEEYRYVTLYRAVAKVSQTAKSFPVTRNLLEWIHRRTTLREQAFAFLTKDGGRPKLTAADVLTAEQLQTIASDLRRLRQELRVAVPSSWNVPRPSGSSHEFAYA
ncbi:MAG: sulfotransferase [Planctomycetaceae bacterium]